MLNLQMMKEKVYINKKLIEDLCLKMYMIGSNLFVYILQRMVWVNGILQIWNGLHVLQIILQCFINYDLILYCKCFKIYRSRFRRSQSPYLSSIDSSLSIYYECFNQCFLIKVLLSFRQKSHIDVIIIHIKQSWNNIMFTFIFYFDIP